MHLDSSTALLSPPFSNSRLQTLTCPQQLPNKTLAQKLCKPISYPDVASKARIYSDVNIIHPKEYWDYEAFTVQWGARQTMRQKSVKGQWVKPSFHLLNPYAGQWVAEIFSTTSLESNLKIETKTKGTICCMNGFSSLNFLTANSNPLNRGDARHYIYIGVVYLVMIIASPNLEVHELDELPEQWRRFKLAWLCKELPSHNSGL